MKVFVKATITTLSEPRNDIAVNYISTAIALTDHADHISLPNTQHA